MIPPALLSSQKRMYVWCSNASTSEKRPGQMGYLAGCSKYVRTSWLVYSQTFSNLSLSTGIVPACFKSSVIIPVQKKSKVTCPNDWRPVALTPIVSKCFEKLIKVLICRMLPPALDPHQFAYRKNRSTDDAIATALHLALAHLDKRNIYVRMLFVDYSSAFNTIVPSRLNRKLRHLGIDPSLYNWILDFLTD